LALALIAGSDNIVSPKATSDAVLPAFIFLGAGMVLVAGAFAFLGIETHGRAIEELDESATPAPARSEVALGTR
jgi:putative MFS transporter